MSANSDLTAKSILLVEDEGIIALGVECALRDAGAQNVFVAMTIAEAQAAAESQLFHAAILDVRLRDGMTHDLAKMLMQRGVSVIFHTGNSDPRALSQEFPKALIVRKPSSDESLVESVRQAMASASAASGS